MNFCYILNSKGILKTVLKNERTFYLPLLAKSFVVRTLFPTCQKQNFFIQKTIKNLLINKALILQDLPSCLRLLSIHSTLHKNNPDDLPKSPPSKSKTTYLHALSPKSTDA